MAPVSGSTYLIQTPSLDIVSAGLSLNEQQDDKVQTLVVQWLSEIVSAPNYCPPKFDPIFNPGLNIISDDFSHENNCGSKDILLTERNYQTLQDESKVGSSSFLAQELNDSATSIMSAEQLNVAETLVISPVDELDGNNIICITDDSASSNDKDNEMQDTVSADQSQEENFESWVLVKAKFWIGKLETQTKRALRWLCSGKLGSMLSRSAGVEIYIITAIVVSTAYGQLLLINMSYANIYIIPVTIIIFIAALCRKLSLRTGVKGRGSNKGKYCIKKVHDLVVVTALPYCFLLLQVLVTNKVKHGADDLVISDFFSFLSSALGAVAVMIALLPVASSPGGAQVLQLIHRTCIIVLTITVHTKAAEWVREDMVLACTQELVTVLVWFTVPFRHGVPRGGNSGGDGGAVAPANVEVGKEEEKAKKDVEVEQEEEEKGKNDVEVEEEEEEGMEKNNFEVEEEKEEEKEKKDTEVEKEEQSPPCEQVLRPSLGVATESVNTRTPHKIIITTVMYMVLTYIISTAYENEGITRALSVCSFSGCLNYFSMRMLQQWPGSAPVSDVPVKLLKVFAKICFAAAAALLVAVIPARQGDLMTSLLISANQTILSSVRPFGFDFLSTKRLFLRSIALEGILFYFRWRHKTNAGRMEQPGSALSDEPVEVFAKICFAVAEAAASAVVISADFMLVSPEQTILSRVRLFEFDFLQTKRRFLTYIALEGILFYLIWRHQKNAGRMERKASVRRDQLKFKLD